MVEPNGTKENPYVAVVDAICPERNGEMYGCDITFVQEIEFNNYSRNTYKGPLRSHWICDHKIFGELAAESGKQIDKFTTRAIKHDALGIKQSPECNWSYHLFIWLISTLLDNSIFLGNPETCKTEVFIPKLRKDHDSNPFKADMNAITICWTVGVSDG
eukprot:13044466-Ditylum_brightwellii.AAC.1